MQSEVDLKLGTRQPEEQPALMAVDPALAATPAPGAGAWSSSVPIETTCAR